jgi:hypothetical protein
MLSASAHAGWAGTRARTDAVTVPDDALLVPLLLALPLERRFCDSGERHIRCYNNTIDKTRASN